MSITLSLTGNSSELTANYFPPIELSSNYEAALIDLHVYNSVPNIDEKCNLFHIGEDVIQIPVGSYELEDIADFIKDEYEYKNREKSVYIEANNNTMQMEVESTHDAIHFEKPNSVGQLFGFDPRTLEPGKEHFSDRPANISSINLLRVECSIVTSTYINDSSAHTLHEFAISVPPGYKIDEMPRNLIYLPVNCREISSLTIRIVDQKGNLINFREEEVTLRLHLKPIV